ncbi:unnamed protein product [Litomosoides sigmodontis]|uniref:Vezatin n=1 Tax=Litomosoides sigmodontis TaxID=42156 RepID=A0A3P6SUP7_LITSI|nr:unnamed protein product [Litomosoides sigmodontis]
MEDLFGSSFFWKVYKLLIEKAIVDDVDLEMIEYYLTSKRETLISSKVSVSCVSVIAAFIACWFSTYPVLCILVFPALFIGLLEVNKRLCYCIISFYANVSADFDSLFHHVAAAIRSREVAFFGLQRKCDMNPTMCLRSFRLELLKVLRCEVQCHVRITRNLCRCDDSELLCNMFTQGMSQLALEDSICEEFLQLSALKISGPLSENAGYEKQQVQLEVFFTALEFLCLRNVYNLYSVDTCFKYLKEQFLGRLLYGLKFINYRDCRAEEKKIRKFSPLLSTTEKILAHLSFASEVLNGDEIPEEEKFLFVAEILRKAVELSTFKKRIEYKDINHQNLSSNSSMSKGTDEDDSATDELPVEKVYEGFSLVSDDQQGSAFLPSWQESEPNEALAKSVVMELKSRLVERVRGMGAAEAEKIDCSQRMATVDNEFQETLTVNEKCDAGKTVNGEYFNIFSSISKNDSTYQSNLKLDLKQAISHIKLGPNVDFTDDPGNDS